MIAQMDVHPGIQRNHTAPTAVPGVIASRSSPLYQTQSHTSGNPHHASMPHNSTLTGLVQANGLPKANFTSAPPPSGPVTATDNIINQKSDASKSLFQICLSLRKRLALVPGLEYYVEEIDRMSSDPNTDIVTSLWTWFRKGTPLLTLYNASRPKEPLEVKTGLTTEKRIAQDAAFQFTIACNKKLGIPSEECFQIRDLNGDDTAGFVKVTQLVSKVLDILQERDMLYQQDEEKDGAPTSNDNSKRTRRDHIILELVTTERKYVQDLEALQGFKRLVQEKGVISGDTIHDIFLNLDALLDFQRRFLIRIETMNIKPTERQNWGQLFVQNQEAFQVYQPYIANQKKCEETAMREFDRLASVGSGVTTDRTTLSAFLLKPFQRLSKYPLMLRDLSKQESNDREKRDLTNGLEVATSILDKTNEAADRELRKAAVDELKEHVGQWKNYNIDKWGELMLHGDFTILKHDGRAEVEKEVSILLSPFAPNLDPMPATFESSDSNKAGSEPTDPSKDTAEHSDSNKNSVRRRSLKLLLQTATRNSFASSSSAKLSTVSPSSPSSAQRFSNVFSLASEETSVSSASPSSPDRLGNSCLPPSSSEIDILEGRLLNNSHGLAALHDRESFGFPDRRNCLPALDVEIDSEPCLPESLSDTEATPRPLSSASDDDQTPTRRKSSRDSFATVSQTTPRADLESLEWMFKPTKRWINWKDRGTSFLKASRGTTFFESPFGMNFFAEEFVKEQLADYKALKSPRFVQYKVYLFHTILICVKDQTIKPKSKTIVKSDKKKQAKFALKGRIYMANVTDVLYLSTPSERSYVIQIFWTADSGIENFMIRFPSEEVMKKWYRVLDKQQKLFRRDGDDSGEFLKPTTTNDNEFNWVNQNEPPNHNPYQEDYDEEEMDGTTAHGSHSEFSMSRNASSTSLRSRSTTGDSGPPQQGRMTSNRYPGQYAQPPLGLNTQIHPNPSNTFSPADKAGQSFFSPAGDTPLSSRTSGSSVYPFPRQPTPNNGWPEEHNRYTAPAAARSGSRDGQNGYGPYANGRSAQRPSLPPNAHQHPQQAGLNQRSRSASSPMINAQNAPPIPDIPVPPFPPHLVRGPNRSETNSPTNPPVPLPIRSVTQSPGMQRDRLPPQDYHHSRSQNTTPVSGYERRPYQTSTTPMPVHEPPSPTQLKVKVSFDNHTVTLVAGMNITYQILADRIDAKIGRVQDASIAGGGMRLRYKDEDGDFVTIKSDEDIHIAFSEWKEQQKSRPQRGSMEEIHLFCQKVD